jgi:hypothetical protein
MRDRVSNIVPVGDGVLLTSLAVPTTYSGL